MGVRFRKSVKLAPGIRMNFGGSGISWTLGPRGASVSVRTRPFAVAQPPVRMSVNINVEDTGELVFTDAAGALISQRLIDGVRKQHGPAIRALIKCACDKVNREVEALGEIHLESPSPLARAAYQPVPFTLPQPSEPLSPRKDFWDRVFKWRWQAKEVQFMMAHAKFAVALADWHAQREAHLAAGEARRKFIEVDILESEPAMERHLEAALQKVQWPRETHVSFDVSPDGSSVALDVDLPEIEDMPARTASVPARGYRLSIKETGPAQKQKLYWPTCTVWDFA